MSDSPRAIVPTSDAREAAIARLADAFAHDVLSMDEFERRTEMAYRAGSASELATLVADLPAATGTGGGQAVGLVALSSLVSAAFSNVARGGAMAVPPRLDIRAVFGNVELDLSEAVFGAGVTEISIRAIFGNVEIRLPSGARVESHGAATLGSYVVYPATGMSRREVQVLATGRAIFANVELDPR